MEVRLTNRNQITIPANIVKQLGLKSGDIYDLSIDASNNNLKIIINIKLDSNSNISLEPEIIKEEIKKDTQETAIKKSNNNKCYIKSNLEESKTFTRRVISECGLLVRTKRSYLNKACEQCQGQLAKEYGVEDHPCKYLAVLHKHEGSPITSSETGIKNIINEIRNNAQKLDEQLSSNAEELLKPANAVLDKVIKKSKPKKIIKKDDNTILELFNSKNYIKCKKCGEYYNHGFLIDNEFHCSKCACKDFQDYLEGRKNKND